MAHTQNLAIVRCDLDDMTLMGHGQILCGILSQWDKGIGSYGLDKVWTDWGIPIYPQTLLAEGLGVINIVNLAILLFNMAKKLQHMSNLKKLFHIIQMDLLHK